MIWSQDVSSWFALGPPSIFTRLSLGRTVCSWQTSAQSDEPVVPCVRPPTPETLRAWVLKNLAIGDRCLRGCRLCTRLAVVDIIPLWLGARHSRSSLLRHGDLRPRSTFCPSSVPSLLASKHDLQDACVCLLRSLCPPGIRAHGPAVSFDGPRLLGDCKTA